MANTDPSTHKNRAALWIAAIAMLLSFWSYPAFPGVVLAPVGLILAYRARAARRGLLLPPEPVSVWACALGWIALAKCAYTIARFFISRSIVFTVMPEDLQVPGMPWAVRYGARFFVTRLLLYFIGVR